MDVKLWSHLSSGGIRCLRGLSCRTADHVFAEHKKLMADPYVTYYRVTLEDPDRGGYVVRDTDWEVHGIGGGIKDGEPVRSTRNSELAAGAGIDSGGGAASHPPNQDVA